MNTKYIASLLLSICVLLSLVNPLAQSSQNTSELLWLPSNEGLNAGIITDIILDEKQHTLWTSTIRGGIFQKKLDSKIWEPSNEGLRSHYVHCLLLSPVGLFAGTDHFLYLWNEESKSWKTPDSDYENTSVSAMTWTIFQEQTILIAGTNKGLFRSEDHGITWQKVITGNQTYHVNSFAKTNSKPGFILASAVGRWALISEDAGKTWKKASETPLLTEIQTLHIDINNTSVWYAGTSQQGILKTIDRGQNWTHQNKNLDNIYVSKIAQDPITAELWISTFDGLFYTKTEELDWSSYEKLPFNTQVNAFTTDYLSNTIYVGTQGDSVYYSKLSEQTWHKLNENMHNAHIREVKASMDGRYLYTATWGSGLFRSSDQGRSWTPINKGISNPLILCFEDRGNGEIYAGTFNDGAFKSRNAGESWEKITAPTLFSKYIYSIAFDPLDHKRIYFGTQDGVYRSVNDGETWSKMGPGSFDQPVGNITAIAINPKEPAQLFIATNSSGIYMSNDGADTWTSASLGLGNNNITSILFHPDKSNIIYASTFGSGVYRSSDSGASWQEMNHDLNNKTIYSLFLEKSRPEIIYAASDSGLYRTLPGSTQWEFFGNGLERISVRDVAVDTKKNSYLVGTYGSGCLLLHQMPPPPQLQEPKNDSEIISLRPTLTWKEPLYFLEPVFYTIQLSEQEDFSSLVYEHRAISGDQFIIPRDLLQKHRSYYWRARSEIGSGGGRWSEKYKFHLVTMIVLRINQAMMKVDHIEKEIDPGRATVPIIRNNRTFLPIRTIIESIGGNIEWDESTQTVSIQVKNTQIDLQIDRAEARVNGKALLIDPSDPTLTPFIQNGRTMLPLRFVGESLEMRVEWQADTQTITLVYPNLKHG
jgi:photosystem II stability/assembly factor-like uncharacterized protein